MIEGLWIVQYEGLQGNDAGVVVFVNGKVLGGDNAYTYEGTYSVRGGAVAARVHVAGFLPGVPSVLGIAGDFDLEIKAPFDEREIRGAMALIDRPGVSVAVRLTKKANL